MDILWTLSTSRIIVVVEIVLNGSGFCKYVSYLMRQTMASTERHCEETAGLEGSNDMSTINIPTSLCALTFNTTYSLLA